MRRRSVSVHFNETTQLVSIHDVTLYKAALTTETKQRKTIPKQIQNNVLFQTLLHVKQNAETIPKRFGIVLELFQSCFSTCRKICKSQNSFRDLSQSPTTTR